MEIIKIAAYKEGWMPYKNTMETYIEQTTLANTKNGVIKELNKYINENVEAEEVIEFLNKVLNDEEILEKIHVVWDGSGRNVVWLIRPDRLEFNIEEYNYCKENAETIFINLDRQSSFERELEWEVWDEYMLEEKYDEELL